MGRVGDDNIRLRYTGHHSFPRRLSLQTLHSSLNERIAFHLFVLFFDLLPGHLDASFMLPPLIEVIEDSQDNEQPTDIAENLDPSSWFFLKK